MAEIDNWTEEEWGKFMVEARNDPSHKHFFDRAEKLFKELVEKEPLEVLISLHSEFNVWEMKRLYPELEAETTPQEG